MFRGMELDECVQWDNEYTAEHSDQQKIQYLGQGRFQPRQQQQAEGDAEGAYWYQSGFDVVAGDTARNQRTGHNPDSRAGENALEYRRVGEAHLVLGECREGCQQHLADGPEYGQADDGKNDDLTVNDSIDVITQVDAATVFIPVEPQVLVRRLPLRDRVGKQQLDNSPNHQEPADGGYCMQQQGSVTVIVDTLEIAFEPDGKYECPRQYGYGGSCLYHAVGLGQVFLAHHFLDISVFGRRINGALYSH